jgi:hypothetical protein
VPTVRNVNQSANALPLASLTAFSRSGMGSGAAIAGGMVHHSNIRVQIPGAKRAAEAPKALARRCSDTHCENRVYRNQTSR